MDCLKTLFYIFKQQYYYDNRHDNDDDDDQSDEEDPNISNTQATTFKPSDITIYSDRQINTLVERENHFFPENSPEYINAIERNINSASIQKKIEAWIPKNTYDIEKLFKNARKAIDDHVVNQADSKTYAKVSQIAFNFNRNFFPESPILDYGSFSWQNARYRSYMEDAHFILNLGDAFVAGVFDGHGGPEVSAFANAIFKRHFQTALRVHQENIPQAIQCLLDIIHDEIPKNSDLWKRVGSTALITYIQDHCIYSATLGDSEANIYRRVGDEYRSVPLSPMRNWQSKNDRARYLEALKRGAKRHTNDLSPDDTDEAKNIRFRGLNVSRAIGNLYTYDKDQEGKNLPNVVSLKAKFTCHPLYEGDIITLCCDGVKDFLSERSIVKLIESDPEIPPNKLAKRIVNLSRLSGSTDNISALVIRVKMNHSQH